MVEILLFVLAPIQNDFVFKNYFERDNHVTDYDLEDNKTQWQESLEQMV